MILFNKGGIILDELLILLVLLMFLKGNKNDFNKTNLQDSFSLNISSTHKKIKILKKISPYFPPDMIPAINKSLFITEKIVKVYETVEFIKKEDNFYDIKVADVNNKNERINYILSTLKREVSYDDAKEIGNGMELILNIDKYKKLASVLKTFLSNPDGINNSNSLEKIIEVMLEGRDEKEKKKITQMVKMFELMQTLDTQKKDSSEDK